MSHVCTDCRKFMNCDKNAEAWAKAKELYPFTQKEEAMNRHPMTQNEKRRLMYINTVAGRCDEREMKYDPL